MPSYRTYSTSQLADAAEVGPQTLRYYERRGLLPEPPRTAGGHRIYDPSHLERLLFIQRAQSLGFQLQEIHEMLDLADRRRRDPSCGPSQRLEELVATVDAKLDVLRSLRRSLQALGPSEAPSDDASTPQTVEALVSEPALSGGG